jgi:hypothetical protein
MSLVPKFPPPFSYPNPAYSKSLGFWFLQHYATDQHVDCCDVIGHHQIASSWSTSPYAMSPSSSAPSATTSPNTSTSCASASSYDSPWTRASSTSSPPAPTSGSSTNSSMTSAPPSSSSVIHRCVGDCSLATNHRIATYNCVVYLLSEIGALPTTS